MTVMGRFLAVALNPFTLKGELIKKIMRGIK
jgi:hypothetical protein